MGPPSNDDRSIHETVATTLGDHPISVGYLFGSRARGEGHDRSDVDVAVAFEDSDADERDHVNGRLALGADLALALETDDVDLIDLRTASPSLVRAIFRDGDRLVGTNDDAQRVREAILGGRDVDPRSPAERFDDVLAAIDDHLA